MIWLGIWLGAVATTLSLRMNVDLEKAEGDPWWQALVISVFSPALAVATFVCWLWLRAWRRHA